MKPKTPRKPTQSIAARKALGLVKLDVWMPSAVAGALKDICEAHGETKTDAITRVVLAYWKRLQK